MSPQKKLILRRNALFRQQLSVAAPCCHFGRSQHYFQSSTPALELCVKTASLDNSATESNSLDQLPAKH